MLSLVLSIIFSVLLLVNFRAHARFKVDTRLAILLNYPICFLTALLSKPSVVPFHWPPMYDSLAILGLGAAFVITFLLSGFSTQKNGMAPTSLANNISLVIPVMINLFIWKTSGTVTVQTIMGLIFSFVAIYFCSPRINERSKPVVWALLAVFLAYGLTNTTFTYLNAKVVESVGGTINFMAMLLLGSITASFFVLLYGSLKREIRWNRQSILAAIPLGLPNYFSFYFLLKALDEFQQDGARVMTIYNLGVIILSAGTAYLFFKERLSRTQWIGIGLGCVGIVLIIN